MREERPPGSPFHPPEVGQHSPRPSNNLPLPVLIPKNKKKSLPRGAFEAGRPNWWSGQGLNLHLCDLAYSPIRSRCAPLHHRPQNTKRATESIPVARLPRSPRGQNCTLTLAEKLLPVSPSLAAGCGALHFSSGLPSFPWRTSCTPAAAPRQGRASRAPACGRIRAFPASRGCGNSGLVSGAGRKVSAYVRPRAVTLAPDRAQMFFPANQA